MSYCVEVNFMKDKLFYINQLKEMQMLNPKSYSYFDLVKFNQGDLLLHQGQKLEYLYILLHGRIKSCHTTSNGLTVLSAFSHAISVIGEVEFLNHRDVINDVYALESVICLRTSVTRFEKDLLNDLYFMRYLAQTISQKLYDTNHNSSISINYPVENRLASYLISCQDHMMIHDNFVQVAEMIGCSYRQLQRTLNDFCQSGYIRKVKRGQFEIMDPIALQHLGEDLYYL